ncbi:coil containing protein [Vibrio phage 2.044.O._10N.261.51.B8]|nr:coil containing protein [Vibrio phage 2.044.O._10N.261.51.B8]
MLKCTPIKENITVYEGDDCTLEFVSSLGDITGASIRLQARIDTSSRYAIIDVDGVILDATAGSYSVILPSGDTLGKASEDAYYYDIKITKANGSVHTDRSGMMTIDARTTDLTTTKTTTVYGVDVDKDGAPVLAKARELNFEGSGVTVNTNLKGGVDVSIKSPAAAPTLALHFSGIYDTLQDLTDAIASPTDHQQAIVLKPSEKYYHGVGNAWVALAPVGSFHPNYLGAYDTVVDLRVAEPLPVDDSLAIVGTTAKSFYIYDGSKWDQVTHTDLPSLDARVTDAESKISKAQNDIVGLTTSVGQNSATVAGIYAKDKPSFDTAVEAHLQQSKTDITNLQAGQGALESNVNQKISGVHVEDSTNNAFDDINSFHFVGAEVSDDGGKQVTVTVKPKITVANGQEVGSTSIVGDTLIFQGGTITADPNNPNVLIIGRTDTPSFDPSMFSSAIDHGYAADDQGIKSAKTTNGWWVFKDLKSVSGRPSDSIGELIVFKNEIPTSNVALKHVFTMAIGQDRDLESKVWFMYRDGTQWTPWFSEQGADQATIDSLTASVNELKSGNAAVLKELEALQTAAGNLYAPTKEAFNKAVTALINAALANYTPVKPGHGGDKPSLVFPRFYAQFSLSTPTSFAGAVTSTNAEATLLRIPTTRSRVFISVINDNGEASKVKGFSINGSLKSSWDYRDTIIDGKRYRAFYSAGAFSEQKVDIKVDFGQGI